MIYQFVRSNKLIRRAEMHNSLRKIAATDFFAIDIRSGIMRIKEIEQAKTPVTA